MQVIVEGAVVDVELPDREVSLREVIDEVEVFLFSVGKVPVGLSIDGKSLTQQELDSSLPRILNATENLEFHVEGVLEFLNQSLKGAGGANEQLLTDLREFAAEIHKANRNVDPKGLVGELQEFFNFWIQLGQLIPDQFKGIDLGGKDIRPFMSDLRDVLEEAVAGLEQSDVVLAADLIEYELVPRIQKLDAALPKLRERVQALQVESEIKTVRGQKK